MKFCKDCGYCVYVKDNPLSSICKHEKGISKLESYPIDGATVYGNCKTMRAAHQPCGPGGTLWRSKVDYD